MGTYPPTREEWEALKARLAGLQEEKRALGAELRKHGVSPDSLLGRPSGDRRRER